MGWDDGRAPVVLSAKGLRASVPGMRRSDGFASLALAVVTLGLFAPALLGDSAVFPWNMDVWHPWAATATPADLARPTRLADCARQFYPMRAVLDAAVDEGRIPLWNPRMLCGTPFLANFQPGVFYPPNLLLAVSGLDVTRQMDLFLAGHAVFGALGVYFLLRSWGVTAVAALLGALTFAWGGFNAARTGIPTMPATGAWLPWALLASRRWFDRRDGAAFAGMALSLAMSGLAGFAQIFVFVAYGWGLFGLVEGARRRPAVSPRTWAGWVAAGLLGLAIVSVHLLPTAEFIRLCTNAENTPGMLASGTLHPWAWAKVAVPDLLGHPADGTSAEWMLSMGDGYYTQTERSTAAYAGILPLLLAAAVVLAPGDRRRATLAGMLLAGLGVALCLHSPLTALLAKLPGLGFSRPDRATYFTTFGLALLAGLGADRLGGSEGPGLSRGANRLALAIAAGIAAFAALFLGTGARLLPADLGRALGDAPVRQAAAIALGTTAVSAALFAGRAAGRTGARAFLALALLVAGADLGVYAWRLNVMQPRESVYRGPSAGGALEFLQARHREDPLFRIFRYEPLRSQFRAVLPPATASMYGLDDVLGFDSLNLERARELLAAVDPDLMLRRGNFRGTTRADVMDSPILDLLGVRYVLAEPAAASTPLPGLTPVHRSDLAVFENAGRLPRAFLVPEVRVIPDAGDLVAALARPPVPLDLCAYSEVPLPGWTGDPGAAGRPAGTAAITEHADERVRVAVDPSGPALLVLADAYYPGWRASVDGVERPIHRVDHLLRGVVVRPGDREVTFEYRPASFRRGALVSALALGLVLVAAVALGRGRGGSR